MSGIYCQSLGRCVEEEEEEALQELYYGGVT